MTPAARLRALLTAAADFETEWETRFHEIPSYNPNADGWNDFHTDDDDCEEFDEVIDSRARDAYALLTETVTALEAITRELEAAEATTS
ncbi:hypothetical protein ACIQOW_32640 [Kitasatospora sp. NPDC091335]|uniref:hypothetical protein n=1 Tax=Kitasatospora sp. NPDC091335 TaxID=3364085 RepID=UPI0037FAFEA2